MTARALSSAASEPLKVTEYVDHDKTTDPHMVEGQHHGLYTLRAYNTYIITAYHPTIRKFSMCCPSQGQLGRQMWSHILADCDKDSFIVIANTLNVQKEPFDRKVDDLYARLYQAYDSMLKSEPTWLKKAPPPPTVVAYYTDPKADISGTFMIQSDGSYGRVETKVPVVKQGKTARTVVPFEVQMEAMRGRGIGMDMVPKSVTVRPKDEVGSISLATGAGRGGPQSGQRSAVGTLRGV